MVENSIDAGAKNITVEIKNGGISFIRITDNGKGIAKDDVELAFERHATSKIRSSDDLDTVKSMGFRGEALASIAAIANVELVTKTEFDETGTRIVIQGGDVLSIDEIGCSKGTTITVRNLFFNTPVRYKFLKKDFTESGYIEDVITRIALINPGVAIKFINTGKIILQTNGSGDLKQVIYSIYGKEVASNIIDVDYEYEYMKIKGVIGKPSISRSNRSNQIFFVNNRYIKDKTLSSAVEQAFKGMLPIGKFAFLILNVEMPPSKVDVNVHPAKLEVRFEDESVAFKAMFHSVKDTLLNSGFLTDREKTQEIKEASKDAFKIKNIEEIANSTYTIENKVKDEMINTSSFITDREPDLIEPKNTILEHPTILGNQDIFEKLKSLQNELKKEVEQNPNLQLTDTYKEMEQKYNNIMEPAVQEEKQEQELTNQNIQEQEDIQNDEIQEKPTSNENIVEQSKEDQEIEAQENETESSNEEQQEEQQQDSKEKIPSFEEMYKELFGKEPYGGRRPLEKVKEKKEEEENFYTMDSNIEDANVSMFEGNEHYQKLKYKFIGIAFNTYIILEIENELYIMDQHAAHERVLYEKVKANFLDGGEKASQILLLPDIISLTHKEMDIAKDNLDLFRKSGFILEEFGDNTIKLSGVPEICVDLDTEELFKETLDEINQVARTAKQEKEERFLATVACKAAVKAHMVLTEEEVDSLMDELLKLVNPFTCPHGRPTVIKMSKYEIERKFARK